MMCPSIPGEYVGEISRPVVDTVRVVHERSRGLQQMIPHLREWTVLCACLTHRRARMDGQCRCEKISSKIPAGIMCCNPLDLS